MSGPNVEAPDSGATGQALGQNKTDDLIIGGEAALDKRFATLSAHLALRGFALHRLTCGGYLIARWDQTAYLPDLRGVSCFLERVGGAA